MTLTPHFSVSEFERSSEAAKHGIPNIMPPDAVCCARALCSAVLEPLRERVGPLTVTSGFRTRELNELMRRLGYSASSTSQHLLGEAADVRPASIGVDGAWLELVELVEAGLPVDQAIVYQRAPGGGWIHVSHTARTAPRRELLVQPATGSERYVPWSRWAGRLVL